MKADISTLLKPDILILQRQTLNCSCFGSHMRVNFRALNVSWFGQFLDFPPWSFPLRVCPPLSEPQSQGGRPCGETLLNTQLFLYSYYRLYSLHPFRRHRILLCRRALCFAGLLASLNSLRVSRRWAMP